MSVFALKILTLSLALAVTSSTCLEKVIKYSPRIFWCCSVGISLISNSNIQLPFRLLHSCSVCLFKCGLFQVPIFWNPIPTLLIMWPYFSMAKLHIVQKAALRDILSCILKSHIIVLTMKHKISLSKNISNCQYFWDLYFSLLQGIRPTAINNQ